MIKVHLIHCGRVCVDRALPFQEKSLNPLAFMGIGRGQDKKLWLPVSVYFIEHPKGKVLIDTSWHTDVRIDAKKHLGRLRYRINQPDLPAGEAVHERLAALGVLPQDLDYVILSHLHDDHASGLPLVKQAKQILVSDVEWLYARDSKLTYVRTMWRDVPNIATFSFNQSAEGLPAFDLFGDGSMVFVQTKGHTQGLASTIISGKTGKLLLCSDVGYAAKSWQQMILPGVQHNKADTIRSLQWVQQFAQRPDCLAIWANHDTELRPQVLSI